MIRKTLVLSMMVGMFVSSGCDIYFGEPGNGNGSGEQPPLGQPGAECSLNSDCMAGCFCSEAGICEEAGFCETTFDCPDEFECEKERASCVPAGKPAMCTDSTQCGAGWYCDVNFGECVPSWTCRNDEECGPAWECNENYTCQPMSCTSDEQCLEGCICDEASGQCVETGFCQRDRDCPDGLRCDLSRNTCTDAPPPLACGDITDENACFARTDCAPVYRGINCRDPNGNLCSGEDANCMCERFVFSECVVR